MFNNSSLVRFQLSSPLECFKLNIFAVVYTIILAASILINYTILWAVFSNRKDTKRSLHWLIIVHTALNLFSSVSELPFIIATHIFCKWLFGQIGCSLLALIMYFAGCTSIYIMVFISIERYYNLIGKTFSHAHMCLAVIFSVFFGLYWSMMPLLGWSYYSLEPSLTSCSIEWGEKSLNVISYNLTIFVFVFTIPFFVILFTNLRIYLSFKNLSDTGSNVAIREREDYLAKIMGLYILLFLIAWTPYASVSFISSFTNIYISPLLSTIPSMFAKTGTIWSSLFYICTDDDIKKKIGSRFGNSDSASENMPSASKDETFAITKMSEGNKI